ncbi:MAG: hypothetical protein ACI845_003429 [Gammaproteobacteria bacterium]|jgi:hypothetical protein
MTTKPDLNPLIQHLCNSSSLDRAAAEKLIDEVLAYFAETVEDYVRRRHRELKLELGLSNPEIYQRLETEISQLVFNSPSLSQRQIRRIIYG